ncbi:hypothetical protein KCU92_g9112, partial [Aureobasidium melanogenum]
MANFSAKKTALVTGCSEGGLGASLALAFARHNFRVFATLREPAKAGNSLSSHPDIQILPLEVTNSSSIASCASMVERETGGTLDVLVNNAGMMFVMPLLDTSIEESKKLYSVNVWGLLAVTQAFAPMLVKSQGTILNIASIAGAVRMAWQGIYNSSKASARWLSETLRIEMQPLGVRVITAMVGEVETKIYANGGVSPTLPATSFYISIKDIIFKQGMGQLQAENEDPEVTAENLVKDVLSGRNGHVWRGGVAGRAKYASWLMPERLFEWLLHSSRGVYDIKP